MSLKSRYCAAQPFANFVRATQANAVMWHVRSGRGEVDEAVLDELRAVGGKWHLLVLAEDWCADAVETVPALARLAELADNVDLRVASREDNLDIMDAHLSPRGGRAIPIVIVLDADHVERAWWGSRPSELQRWVDDVGHALTKEERYRETRQWYARDRGASVIREIVALITEAARERRVA